MTVLKPSISRPRAEPDADPPARTESRRRERNLLKELPFWNLDGGVVELRNRVLEVGFELILPDSDFISAEGLHELSDTYLYVIRSCTPDRERFRMIAEINPAIENPLDDYLAGVTTTNPQLRDLVQSRYQMQNAIFEAGGVRQWRIHCSCSLSTFKAPGMQPFSEDEWVKVLEEALPPVKRVTLIIKALR